jgi:hypothetical protein
MSKSKSKSKSKDAFVVWAQLLPPQSTSGKEIVYSGKSAATARAKVAELKGYALVVQAQFEGSWLWEPEWYWSYYHSSHAGLETPLVLGAGMHCM